MSCVDVRPLVRLAFRLREAGHGAIASDQTSIQPPEPMSKLQTLESLLIHEIKDLHSAETQLVKALPKMAKAASESSLRDAFETHLEETKIHVERLEKVAELLGAKPGGKTCKAMKGLVEEGEETIKEEGEPGIKDLALIGAAPGGAL